MAGEDFRDAARDARDAVSDQWNNPDSALNTSVDSARDQWNRPDSGLNQAWDWLADGIGKHFKRQSDNPAEDGTYNAGQIATAFGLSFVASRLLSGITGAPSGALSFVMVLAVGAATSAALGHLGASQAISDAGRDIVGADSLDTEYAGFELPEELEVG